MERQRVCSPAGATELASAALVLVRVERGRPCPDTASLRAALQADRERLALPPNGAEGDIEIVGPYAIRVDGRELDEYVVWER